MRKTGKVAVTRSLKGPKGADVDQLLEKIRARIYELGLQEAMVTKMGCILAHAHFKTGTNKMYLLSPSENGSRKFTYVGVDQKKQEEARAAIDRYAHREDLRRQIRSLTLEREAAMRDLGELHTECARIVTMDGKDQNGIFRFGDRARRRAG